MHDFDSGSSSGGAPHAADQLLPLVYEELRRLARIDGDALGIELIEGYTVPPGRERILTSRSVEPEGDADREPQGILAVQNCLSEFEESSRGRIGSRDRSAVVGEG